MTFVALPVLAAVSQGKISTQLPKPAGKGQAVLSARPFGIHPSVCGDGILKGRISPDNSLLRFVLSHLCNRLRVESRSSFKNENQIA